MASLYHNGSEMPEGAHFAGMKQPELLVNDIRKFVFAVQAQHTQKML